MTASAVKHCARMVTCFGVVSSLGAYQFALPLCTGDLDLFGYLDCAVAQVDLPLINI